jgi:hypothetical protein
MLRAVAEPNDQRAGTLDFEVRDRWRAAAPADDNSDRRRRRHAEHERSHQREHPAPASLPARRRRRRRRGDQAVPPVVPPPSPAPDQPEHRRPGGGPRSTSCSRAVSASTVRPAGRTWRCGVISGSEIGESTEGAPIAGGRTCCQATRGLGRCGRTCACTSRDRSHRRMGRRPRRPSRRDCASSWRWLNRTQARRSSVRQVPCGIRRAVTVAPPGSST